MQSLSIGRLAGATGCSIPTIRYYESIGLLPKARRAVNGHRCYSHSDVEQLRFLKRCRDFGFSIEQTRELFTLTRDGGSTDCTAALSIVQPHIDSLREKIRELQALETTLSEYVERCGTECRNDQCNVVVEWRE